MINLQNLFKCMNLMWCMRQCMIKLNYSQWEYGKNGCNMRSTYLYDYSHHVLRNDSVLPPAVRIPTAKRPHCALDWFLTMMAKKHHLNTRSANHHAVSCKVSDIWQLFKTKLGKKQNKVCLCFFLLTHLVNRKL